MGDELRAAAERTRRWYQWEHNHYEPAEANPYPPGGPDSIEEDREEIVRAWLNEHPTDPTPRPPRE